MAGVWFDELSVGQVFQHPIRRTVTETDNVLFSAMTHNPALLHMDEEYCRTETEFGRRIVNSCFTLGLMVGISVGDTTLGTLRQPRLGRGALPEAPVPRRHRAGGDRGGGAAGVALQARPGHRHLRAPRLQPARRTGRPLQALRPAAEAPGVRLRSWLFVPGDSEKKLAKIDTSGADAVILDLEDAVAAQNKTAARSLVRDVLQDRPPRRRSPQLWVRINPLDTPLALADLVAVVPWPRMGSCCPRPAARRTCRRCPAISAPLRPRPVWRPKRSEFCRWRPKRPRPHSGWATTPSDPWRASPA